MSHKESLVTPVGRLVQGSLYEPQTTGADKKPLTTRTGPNAGQPRVEYYFALAIEKGTETHWNQTKWGAIVWNAGQSSHPAGQANLPNFAWKITDGDSQIPNSLGRKPCDREGYQNHWVLNFSSGFAPQITADGGSRFILEPDFVNLGDYLQVAGTIRDNESPMNPGIFLNHSHVCFNGFGTRIVLGIDPKTIGFDTVVHHRAHSTPVATMTSTAQILPPILPHTSILIPPVPTQRVMLPAAKGNSYEQLIGNGWTDETLIRFGLMSP